MGRLIEGYAGIQFVERQSRLFGKYRKIAGSCSRNDIKSFCKKELHIVVLRRKFLYHLTHLEDWQIHRNYHAADKRTQDNHDYRLHQTGNCRDGVIDLAFEKVCNFA